MEQLYSCGEYPETEQNTHGDLEKIRSLLKEKYHLVVPDHCNKFLLRCLRQKDGNLENAARLVQAYQNTIKNFCHWDAIFRPSLAAKLLDTGISMPLKFRDAHGRFVAILRPGLWDPQEVSVDQGVVTLWMLTQYTHIQLTYVQRNGFVAIYDFTHFSLQHAWAVKILRLLTLAKWAKNGAAGRFRELHVINHPSVVEVMYKAIRPFLTHKLKTRITFHDGRNSLLHHLDGKILPKFLGGVLDAEDCVDKDLLHGFFNSDQFFIKMMDIGFPTE